MSRKSRWVSLPPSFVELRRPRSLYPSYELEDVGAAGCVEHVGPPEKARERLAIAAVADKAKAGGRRNVYRDAAHVTAFAAKRKVQADVGFHACRPLLHPPVKITRTAPPAADIRIGVDELVRGELVDIAGLRLALPVRERGRDDVVGHRLVVLVDSVSAEHRQAAPHDASVFLRRAGHAVVGRDLGDVAGDMDLGEAAVGGKDQNALGGLAERKRFLAV